MLFDYLKTKDVELNYKHSVENIKRTKNGLWEVKVHDMNSGKIEHHTAKFVFIGGGGGSLPLLQKSWYSRIKTYWWIPSKWTIYGM
ncbi:malate:quinone oxidoreductase [Bacillus cereus]